MLQKQPFIEYVTIGIHTSIWIILTAVAVFYPDLELEELSKSIKPLEILLTVFIIPVFFIIGLLIDQLCYSLLNPLMKRIRNRMFNNIDKDHGIKYTDEWLGLQSIHLYNEYKVRVLRSRILASMIFNWPLTGLGVIFLMFRRYATDTGVLQVIIAGVIIIVCGGLGWYSLYTWKAFFTRAYKFRKTACDAIIAGEQTGGER